MERTNPRPGSTWRAGKAAVQHSGSSSGNLVEGSLPAPEEEPWVKKRNELQRLEQATAQVVHLAQWPDCKRAMPCDFVACALFAAIQDKDSKYCDGLEIANANGVRITFKGKRLTQVHADVWEGIMHLARGCPEGTRVRFRARAFLRLIGRHTGKSQRDQLHSWITDLVATNVEVVDRMNRRRYFGSMLPEGIRDDSSGDNGAYVIEINRHLCRLFESGRATINWEERRKLRGKYLALWLQHYFARFRRPVGVTKLHRLSGSIATLKSFRRNLIIALAELDAVGGHQAFVDHANDSVVPRSETVSLPAGPVTGLAPVIQSRVPAISAGAVRIFCQRYPEHDAQECRSDFCAWLAATKRTAHRPDAAFLGFAKKWVAGRQGPAPSAHSRE
jgi:hypothetical protein